MRWDVVALALFSPLPFLALGLAAIGPGRDPLLAPAMGCALSGFVAEIAMMMGLPVGVTVVVAALIAAVIAWWRWRRDVPNLSIGLKIFGGFYAYSAFTASLSPFPIIGAWGGDWLILLNMGRAVADRSLGADPSLLSRPPLFGAATAPLWLFSPGLLPYQFMSIVASAAALGATFVLLRRFRPHAPWEMLGPLLLSPFFLHHNAAAWGKFLSAALVLGALLEAWDRRWIAASLWIAFAVAVHDSAVIFVPVALWIAFLRTRAWGAVGRLTLLMAVAGAFVAAPIELWEIAKFGLAAKIAANPAVADQAQMPWLLKTAVGVVSCFVAWDPFTSLLHWSSKEHPLARETVIKESFWLISSWVTSLTSTLAGLLFPFVRRGIWRSIRDEPHWKSWAVVLAIPVFAANALTPYFSAMGTAQAGLVPLSFGLYAWLVSATPLDPALGQRFLRDASFAMACVGTLPWALMNLLIAAGLHWSAGFRHTFAAGSEGEYMYIVSHGMESLGLVAFPWFPALVGLVAAAVFLRGRARVKAMSPV